MTVIETPTREQVKAEREALVRRLSGRYGTNDREQLRDISVSGEMPTEDATAVERLMGLDYLLSAG